MQQPSFPVWTQAPASFLVKALNNQSNSPDVAQIWLYQAFQGVENTLEQIDRLVERGYQHVGTEWLWFLSSQLHETLSVMSLEQRRGDLWASKKSIDYIRRCPVILGSEMEFPEDVVSGLTRFANIPTIPMFNPFPLPQAGQVGFILNPDKPETPPAGAYRIMDLPLEARQHWAQLSDMIRELSSPLDTWPPYNSYHGEAKDDTTYYSALTTLQRKMTSAPNKAAKEDTMRQLAELVQARDEIERLQKVWDKPDRQEQWAKIAHLAQLLAQDYYEYHQSRKTINAPASAPVLKALHQDQSEPSKTIPAVKQALLPFAEQIPTTPPPEKAPKRKKGRRPAQTPQRAISTRKEYLTVPSAQISYEIARYLRNPDALTRYPKQKIARYQLDLAETRWTIDLGDGNEAWTTIDRALETFGDGLTDSYYAINTLGLERNGAERICDAFLINPDDILEICGKEKSHGSFTTAQRAKVIAEIKTLSLIRVHARIPKPTQLTIEKRGRGRPKRGEARSGEPTYIEIKGPLIDLQVTIGEYSTITGEELWERQSVSIGGWAKSIGLTSKTAIMLRKVLRYSAKNQKYQKRMGIFVTQIFRWSAWNKGIKPNGWSRRSFCEKADIRPDYDHPGRFKDMFNDALDDLVKQEIIGRWWVQVSSSPEGESIQKDIKERAYGWFDLWLEEIINFSPPELVKEHYLALDNEARQAKLQQSQTFRNTAKNPE